MSKFFFKWHQENQKIDLDHECPPEDLKILDAELIEEEGRYALLKLRVPSVFCASDSTAKAYGSFGHLSDQVGLQIIFQGRLMNVLHQQGGYTKILEFRGCCDLRDRGVNLLKTEQNQNLLPRYIYVPPIEQEPAYISAFMGKRCLEIQNFYDQSLSVKATSKPLSHVRLKITAKWLRVLEGRVDLSAEIRKSLPKARLETFFGNALRRSWETSSMRNISKNLTIREAGLTPVPSDPQEIEIQSRRFKKSSFIPQVIVDIDREEEVLEECILELRSEIEGYRKGYSLDDSEVKEMVINLGWVTPDQRVALWVSDIFYSVGERIEQDGYVWKARVSHRSKQEFKDDSDFWERIEKVDSDFIGIDGDISSFFQTKRGHEKFLQALEKVVARILFSHRGLHVSLATGLMEGLSIQLSDTVSVVDDRLPGKKITGKIIQKRVRKCGKTGVGKTVFKIAVPLLNETALDYEKVYQVLLKSVLSNSEKPQLQMNPCEVLREVRIENDAEYQNYCVHSPSFDPKSLTDLQTKLELHFEDFGKRRKHTQTLTIPTPVVLS